MAIKFQYNKNSLNELNKQLKTRTRALPTLKSKESALRLEVKKAKKHSESLVAQLETELKSYEYHCLLDVVVGRFQQIVKCAVDGVVLARLHFDG